MAYRTLLEVNGDVSHLLQVTTQSGAVYVIDVDSLLVTGGSLNLKAGELVGGIFVGQSMTIRTHERHAVNPDAADPGVVSTPVIEVKPI